MSIGCTAEGEIEYLDEILVFSEEANGDPDFMEFSRQVLSMSSDSRNTESSDSFEKGVLSTYESEAGTNLPLSSPRSGTSKDRKKNRKFVPGKHTSVGKNDIRRQYAQMYIDALNSGNVPIFKKSLKDFASPDCVLITRNISSSGMFLPSIVETHGVDAISMFYEAFIKSTPDCTFELHSSTIRVFSDGTSSIICKYTLNATKVFALAGLEENGNQKVVLSLDPVEELTSRFGAAQLNATVFTTVDDPVTGNQTEVNTQVKVTLGEVHKNKSKLAIFGTINLFMNTDKRVFRIDFAMSDLNEQRERERLQENAEISLEGSGGRSDSCDSNNSSISNSVSKSVSTSSIGDLHSPSGVSKSAVSESGF